MSCILITGTGGLIGSACAEFYLKQYKQVIGIDNNFRATYFGKDGDTSKIVARLKTFQTSYGYQTRYHHINVDIANFDAINVIFQLNKPEAVIHCAAQPSHDLAAKIPLLDFATNAQGTLNLLEACRIHTPNSPFVHVSTNKVYGDAPNNIKTYRSDTRYRYTDEPYRTHGINETMTIDNSTHSLFGCSKLAGDIYAQEYGKYFGLKTGIFRGGCLTGPSHASVPLHGFMSYIVKCAKHNQKYTIFGYDGCQVRDQIHSHDVVMAFDEFIRSPDCGEVYNLGGGYENSISVKETISLIRDVTGRHLDWEYSPAARKGDHICYISDMTKFKKRYPRWKLTKSLRDIILDIYKDA